MFIDKLPTEGLAHFSYVVGDGTAAAVIDPRRDCDIYIDMARERGAQITHILETHSHEDFVSGALNLAEATGAKIYHGPKASAELRYGETMRDGDLISLGNISLRVLETPGHSDDSVCFVMADREFGSEAIAVFTGDTLFIGNVGRSDLVPERAELAAGQLYDSLQKLMALGDQTIIFPAHGAGSICADKLADRDFSTIGFERRNNPMLHIADRAKFIERKLAEQHYTPPYFRLMARLNKSGMEEQAMLAPPPLAIAEFNKLREDAIVVDVRDTTAFIGAHIPGSLSLPVDTVPHFAGWLLEPEQSVLLVAENDQQARRTAQHLARIGYDNLVGYLAVGLPEWIAAGQDFSQVPTLSRAALDDNLPEQTIVVDVRSRDELSKSSLDATEQIYLGELPRRLSELQRDDTYLLSCASGTRATIAASLMRRVGFDKVSVFLGAADELNDHLPQFINSRAEGGLARQGALFY